ncbi:MAG TPA: tellurite resistance TerB family protein [Paracoccaceae bacterium]|nr:tellurite resistance TerB family protein [Paracoccaceae bacterium]
MQDQPILDVFTPQDALVAVMVGVSAADENLTTSELLSIARMVDSLPAFNDYDHDRIKRVSRTVFHLYEREDGIDILFDRVRQALTPRLYETAYALACDVAAADGHAFQVELQYLLELRHTLDVDRLTAAAIEKGAAARHRRIDNPAA